MSVCSTAMPVWVRRAPMMIIGGQWLITEVPTSLFRFTVAGGAKKPNIFGQLTIVVKLSHVHDSKIRLSPWDLKGAVTSPGQLLTVPFTSPEPTPQKPPMIISTHSSAQSPSHNQRQATCFFVSSHQMTFSARRHRRWVFVCVVCQNGCSTG